MCVVSVIVIVIVICCVCCLLPVCRADHPDDAEHDDDDEPELDAATGEAGGDGNVDASVEDHELYDGEVGRGHNGWISLVDTHGYLFYFNEYTGATQWDKPEGY